MVRIDVRDGGQPEKGVELRGVGHDQDVVDRGRERRDDALDDAPATQLDERFRAAPHPRALAAGLDDPCDSHSVGVGNRTAP